MCEAGSGCYGVGLKPGDLIMKLRKGGAPSSGYLFLGAEPFYRSRCRLALSSSILGAEPDEGAKVEIDLKERSLDDLLDEARTPSLFCRQRLVVGRNAEAAIPSGAGHAARQAKRRVGDYFAGPLPGTTVILEAVRYDSGTRDGKAKLKRVAKFYDSVPVRVDLNALSTGDARFVGQVMARRAGLDIRPEVLTELVEMLGADAFRIDNEIAKLALYRGKGGRITTDDLEALVPEARQSGVFQFSEAVAARDKALCLQLLDTMSKSGTYWPMQLNLIAGLFRQTLSAKEVGARTATQIQSKLGKYGFRIWLTRARQLETMASRFEERELREALIAIFETYRGLRETHLDDRMLMEMLVMRLTSGNKPRNATAAR